MEALFGDNSVIIWAQRNATALRTSCKLSPNMCSFMWSNVPKKLLLDLLISASLRSSKLHFRNISKMPFGSSPSKCCQLTHQISISSNRAPRVGGFTRQKGSITLDTRLSTKRCVKELVSAEEIHLLITIVSLLRSYTNPGTFEDSSVDFF